MRSAVTIGCNDRIMNYDPFHAGSECDRFGPMMSLKTAITLARNNGDPRLFQPLKVIIKPESTVILKS